MFLVTRKNVFDATCNNHNLYISQTSWKGLSFGLIFCGLCLGDAGKKKAKKKANWKVTFGVAMRPRCRYSSYITLAAKRPAVAKISSDLDKDISAMTFEPQTVIK